MNMSLKMLHMVLLTVVLPEILPSLVSVTLTLYEYAPTATDMPPPYTFAPFEDKSSTDCTLQFVNVLLEMA